MPKLSRSVKITIVVIAVAAVAFFGWQFWQSRQNALPSGIASGNGRIEAKLIDPRPRSRCGSRKSWCPRVTW